MSKEYRRRRKEAQEQTKRLLFRISSYVKYLGCCSQQSTPLPVLPQHKKAETEIRSNPYSQRLVASVSIPPCIQTVIMEELFLLREKGELLKQTRYSKAELQALESRIKIVRVVLSSWYRFVESISLTNIFTPYKNVTPFIGDNWELFFVENIILQLPHHKSPKGK